MTIFASSFSLIISSAAILGQALVLALIASFVFKKDWHLTLFAKKHAVLLSFLTAASGMVASLVYSNIIGFPPCSLCYIQRLFLYPQVVILGIALFKKSSGLIRASIGLSAFGTAVAVYHYYGQMFNADALTCNISTNGASLCAQVPFIEFGYITIPMLSITSFILIISLLMNREKNKTSA